METHRYQLFIVLSTHAGTHNPLYVVCFFGKTIHRIEKGKKGRQAGKQAHKEGTGEKQSVFFFFFFFLLLKHTLSISVQSQISKARRGVPGNTNVDEITTYLFIHLRYPLFFLSYHMLLALNTSCFDRRHLVFRHPWLAM